MPVAVTYPGVYIEELPSSVRTVVGVATSITAFIGRAQKGPENRPVLIHSYADYERVFGGLWKHSSMSYAVYLYFLNGGKDAIIVRMHRGAKASSFMKVLPQAASEEEAAAARAAAARVSDLMRAANPGKWPEDSQLEVEIENYSANEPAELSPLDNKLINLTIRMVPKGGTESAIVLEKYYNLSLLEAHPRRADKVLEAESQLISIPAEKVKALVYTPEDNDYDRIKGTYTPREGADGENLTADEIKGGEGGEAKKQGIYALEDADIFNLLCIPPFTAEDESSAEAIYAAAEKFCEKRRAIFLVDPPLGWKRPENVAIGGAGSKMSRDKNAAVFYPRVKIQDPLEQNRTKIFVPSPIVAGVIARTDSERGIWKSPAGIEATLTGVIDLDYNLTDGENGTLNPKGINCLRSKGAAGFVVWGARTLRGEDMLADQWKYLAVRRMALYIEETLFRATQWVIFEPNDLALQAQVRLNVEAFMHDLFLKGAFQGSTPKEAYLVKCDRETTTQYDIDRGILNIIVGFAPLKPAEFVIIKIQQLAGQEAQ